MSSEESAYKKAGVDIDAQDRALHEIKDLVKSTRTPGVLSDIGSFGGLFDPAQRGLEEPILVSSADGVGTKLMVAKMAGDYSSVGADLVNHCVNDILVQGAEPLFFMDYVGAGRLDPEHMRQLVGGVARACRRNDCALLGGETAEMPGFYQEGDYELVGFIVGAVERRRILDGRRVEEGDLLIGLPSAGLHTNGFSLARKALLELGALGLDDIVDGTRRTVRQHLLDPHLSYLGTLRSLLGNEGLHAMAHITGGGLTDNVPRVLPEGLGAFIRLGTWEVPELFRRIQELASVETDEMLRVFNMGVGMVLVVGQSSVADVLAELKEAGQASQVIGSVQAGDGVVYDVTGGELDPVGS